GRDEIWFFNYNTNLTAQLTFNGANYPSWSPNPRYIAFTTFRTPGSNGDIWIMDVKGYKLLTPEDIQKMDSREPTIWPITHGSALDGFPSWSADAQKVIFLRYDHDSNRDGQTTPSDVGQIWTAEVLPSAQDQPTLPDTNPMFHYLAKSFNFLAVQYAWPLTSGAKMAVQPWCGANDRVYFTSNRGGNYDIWSLPSQGHIAKFPNAEDQFNFADSSYALPLRMSSRTLGPMYHHTNNFILSDKETVLLWDRIIAFQRVIDYFGTMTAYAAKSFYQIGICYHLLGYTQEAIELLELVENYFTNFPEDVAFAKILALDLRTPYIEGRLDSLKSGLERIISQYRDYSKAAAAAQIVIGDLLYDDKNYAAAFHEYIKVIDNYSDQRDACAESQLKIGDVFQQYATKEEVVQAYLHVVQNYPEQRQWMVPARNRILDLLCEGLTSEDKLIARYREIVGQYGKFELLAAAAQLRIGEILYKSGDYAAAYQEYELVKSIFPQLTEEIFTARMKQVQCLMQMNESLRAFSSLEVIINDYHKSRPEMSRQAFLALIDAYVSSGNSLKYLRDYELAIARYRKAKQMAPRNIDAHRGYIECMYYLRRIDQAVNEYEILNKQTPHQNILIYALGLAYSYKGTEKAELENNPDALNPEVIHRSSATIARALSYDFTLVQAYLTIAYNYEMMETYEARKAAKPKSFFTRAFETVTAPVISIYQTLTFYEERQPARYYERAIHELRKAITLNDEKENPGLEANLALNLGNNYYYLGEFAHENAYKYYHDKLKYDSTFVDKAREALIYERMGHCALTIEDDKRGPKYLKKAILYSQEQGNETRELLNTKRLALLYEVTNHHDMAIEYYQRAAEIEIRNDRSSDLEKSYRNIAFNYLQLGETKDAIFYGKKAQNLLQSGKIKKVYRKPSRIKVGFLGLYFPIPFIDFSGLATNSVSQFTTKDEQAVIYTIIGSGYQGEKNYDNAIEYLQKKLELYNRRKEPIRAATCYNNIGYLYFIKGDLPSAWRYFAESLEICEKENVTYGYVMNTMNLARIITYASKDRLNNGGFSKPVLPENLAIAAKAINNALEITNNNVIQLKKQHCHLLMYLAELSLLDFENIQPDNISSQIFSSFARLQNASYAQLYYQEALQFAKQNDMKYEECAILYCQAELFFSIKENEKAFNGYKNSRRLALRNDFFDLLWQIDTSLGILIELNKNTDYIKTLRKSAIELFKEAIHIIEIHPPSVTGIEAFVHRKAIQKPYKQVVLYFFKENETDSSLITAENLRAKLFYDLMRNESIELRKERHKILFGNIKFVREKISEQDIEILRLENSENVSPAQLKKEQQRKEMYVEEYNDLLNEIRTKVPELESLLQVNAVNLQDVQTRLSDHEKIIYFTSISDFIILWNIYSNKITCDKIPVSPQTFTLFEEWFSQSNRPIPEKLQPFLQTAFLPEPNISHWIIIPDWEFLTIPWAIVLQKSQDDAIGLSSIVTSSSLTSYFYAQRNKRISGTKLYSGVDQPDSLFQRYAYLTKKPIRTKEENSFSRQVDELATSDAILLDLQCDWNLSEPSHSRLGYRIKFSSPAVFTPLELYNVSMNPSFIFLNSPALFDRNAYESIVFLERALIYSGVPTIIFSKQQPSGISGIPNFLELFLDKIKTLSIAQAVYEAQKSIMQMNSGTSDWVQVYGYGGMSEQESEVFAEQGFEYKVRQGNSAFDRGDWNDAYVFFSQAYDMAKKYNDTQSQELLRQLLLESCINGGLWQNAVEIQQQMVEEAQSEFDLVGVANGYSNLAYFYSQAQDYEKALEYRKKYTQMAEQYGLEEEEAKSLQETGYIFSRGGNYIKAIEAFQDAEKIYLKLDMPFNRAQCYQNIGDTYYYYLDNYPRALFYQNEALPLFEMFGKQADVVVTLNKLGVIYERMANYKVSFEYYKRALIIAQELNDPGLIGECKQYHANVLWKMGDFQEALTFQKEAYVLFEQNDSQEFMQVAKATQGLIALSLGNPQDAIMFEREGLELAVKNDNKVNQATIYKNIGMIQRSQKQNLQALKSFKTAAQIDSSIGSKRGMAYDLRNLGSIYIEIDSIQTSEKNIQDALKLSAAIGDGRNLAQSLLVLGKIRVKQTRLDSAMANFQKAAEMSRSLFIPDIEWRALKELAKIYVLLDKPQAAVDVYYQALRVIEKMRAKIRVEEYASGFVDDKLDVYGDLISLLVNLKKVEDAFHVAERAKSRSFLDMLGNHKINFIKSDSLLVAQRDSINALLAEKQMTLAHIQDRDQIEAINTQINKLQDRLNGLLIKIREINPELSDIIAVDPWPATKIQNFLPADAAVLEYYIYNDQIYIWFLSAEEVKFFQTRIDSKDVEEKVFTMRRALERQLSISSWSESLYDVLIKPHEENISGIQHICIVPFRFLHYLPFAVLQNSDKEYLGFQHTLSLAPSATVLGFCLQKGEKFVHQNRKDFQVLALGNPDLGEAKFDLPFAEREVNSISRYFTNVKKSVHSRASETELVE
ncbi:tetratricopeptide repeat protein, partial [candidate division KSB1 bacterium]|nr:tetratricopeptide repeat protein [candidate division KSB1 bacterium]